MECVACPQVECTSGIPNQVGIVSFLEAIAGCKCCAGIFGRISDGLGLAHQGKWFEVLIWLGDKGVPEFTGEQQRDSSFLVGPDKYYYMVLERVKNCSKG